MPHDLVYGPDNNIWYTERFAGTVSFVNPATGVKQWCYHWVQKW